MGQGNQSARVVLEIQFVSGVVGHSCVLGFAIRMHVLRSVTNWYKTLASGVAWAQSKHVCVLLGILSGT